MTQMSTCDLHNETIIQLQRDLAAANARLAEIAKKQRCKLPTVDEAVERANRFEREAHLIAQLHSKDFDEIVMRNALAATTERTKRTEIRAHGLEKDLAAANAEREELRKALQHIAWPVSAYVTADTLKEMARHALPAAIEDW